MRIRKNAKLSSLICPPRGSRSGDVYVCQLNQSPWDVISFPREVYPSVLHQQLEADDSLNGNGSLGDSIGAVESVASMMESGEKTIMKMDGMAIDDNDDNDKLKIAKQFGFKSQYEEGDKESRQQALLKSCNKNNSSDSGDEPSSLTSKKAEKNNLLIGSRRGRARAAKKGSSSARNPHQFYYYSGFGPSWGKRRGGSKRAGEIISKLHIEAKEVENNSSAVTTQNNTTPSSSQIENNEEIDYVDDDEEDDDDYDENVDSGKKRMRKPIKARSLKSLM